MMLFRQTQGNNIKFLKMHQIFTRKNAASVGLIVFFLTKHYYHYNCISGTCLSHKQERQYRKSENIVVLLSAGCFPLFKFWLRKSLCRSRDYSRDYFFYTVTDLILNSSSFLCVENPRSLQDSCRFCHSRCTWCQTFW